MALLRDRRGQGDAHRPRARPQRRRREPGPRHRGREELSASVRSAAFVVALLASAGCASVDVTPAAIAQANAPEDARREASERLRDSVQLANEFLASDWRRTLPPGRYELDDVDGLRFVTPLGTWPIAARCNWWGDVVVAFGFAAQEREYGFACGSRPPARDRAVDNSWLAYDDSAKSTYSVAELLLHETTHVVWREGTVGFWNGVAYYLECVFLFRTNDHSAERRPRATGEEFTWFWLSQQNGELGHAAAVKARDDHLATPHDHCEHGPFDSPPPTAPTAPRS